MKRSDLKIGMAVGIVRGFRDHGFTMGNQPRRAIVVNIKSGPGHYSFEGRNNSRIGVKFPDDKYGAEVEQSATLASIKGPYAEVLADWTKGRAAQEKQEKIANDQHKAERIEREARWAKVVEKLTAAKVHSIPSAMLYADDWDMKVRLEFFEAIVEKMGTPK